MSPVVARLRRARRALAITTAARTVTFIALAVLLVLGAGLALDALVGLPLGMRRALLPLAIIAGVGVLVRSFLADGGVRDAFRATDESVALWFERRIPSLQYALVTSVDARFEGAASRLERTVAAAPLEREVTTAARGALVKPALVVAALVAGLLLMPDGAVARVTTPAIGDALERLGARAAAARDPLATIVVRVTPPAYSGLRAASFDDPSTVAALAGSRIVIEGRGAGEEVRAAIGPDTLRASGDWSISLPTPREPTAVRLLGPVRERVLVIDPIADSLPGARLDQPVRDSVLRAAAGQVTLSAEVRDDHGLADAAFEFIISTGAGETFTFRSGRVGDRRFDAGARVATLSATLALDTLKLAPGDLIHLRAVARDRNDVTGPGIGVSETRTLRIARRDEYDSVSVDPMPPTEPEKNALSQRMILMMTEELVAKRPRPRDDLFTDESRRIAREQTRLRKRVGEIVFLRLGEDNGEHEHFSGDGHEHAPEGPVNPDQILAAAEAAANASAARMLETEGDESPIVAINRPLLEAYNHMWRAATELETAKPAAAIPWMKRAIEALQRARAAERIYLRGRPPRVVVDIAKVRGSGKETGASNVRVPRAPADAERAARLARFDVALGIVSEDASAAADSLLLLRLTVPEEDRAAALALDAAAQAVRKTTVADPSAATDVTEVLSRARRALAGPPVRQSAIGPWGM